MKDKRKSHYPYSLGGQDKGKQNSTKLLIFCPSIITHQFIGGNYDETFN